MRPTHTAALKTLLVILSIAVLLDILIQVFELDKIVFESFLFDPAFYGNPKWIFLAFLIVIGSDGVTGMLGYMLAKKKNRNVQYWTGLCFMLNIWGVIFLSFLPPLNKRDT
jgi:hypothetical protein